MNQMSFKGIINFNKKSYHLNIHLYNRLGQYNHNHSPMHHPKHEKLGNVPFMTTPLKGRFGAFSH